MSVYTTIESDELEDFLTNYSVGTLRDFEGISEGIENTNYFVNTANNGEGQFVLTLFEHHTLEEMQYYLGLMHHLADHQVPSADPVADNDNQYVRLFKDKPAALVHRLKGYSIRETTVPHCGQIGAAMGKMHTAGLSYEAHQPNPRGPAWCVATADAVYSKLPDEDVALLKAEIDFQRSNRDADIPRGVVHADLFRDNALWDGDTLSGIIDFYYACDDVLLYDVAVLVNDWCSNDDASLNREKVLALLSSYNSYRPVQPNEQQYWPAMLRAGALRFWLSRLYDKHFPRPGELVHTKDPDEFRAILNDRVANSATYRGFWV
ncbi:MAG: homoserine kinase [Gammaproteobacteria bacterium]|jgi:homoserine kinase type II